MKYLIQVITICLFCLSTTTAIAQDSIYDHSFKVTSERMNRYYQDKTVDLKDGIIEDVQTVLQGLLNGNKIVKNLDDWGDYLAFSSNVALANGKYIYLCEEAADWYYKKEGSNKLEKYLLALNPLANYYQSTGQLDSATAVINKVQKQAFQYKNYPILAETFYVQGTYLYAQNDLAGASDCWDYALDYFNMTPDKDIYVDYVKVLNGLTLSYFTIGNYSKSLPYAKQYLAASKNKYGNQSAAYAAALCVLAKDQYNLQQTDSAILNLKQASEICENNPSISSQLRSGIEQTYRQFVNIKEDAHHTLSGISNDAELNDSTAPLLDTDATSFVIAHKDREALGIYERLFPFYESRLNKQNVETFVRITSQMINCYESLGEYAKGEIIVNKCLEDLVKNKLKTYQLRSLYASYGLLCFYLQNYSSAISNLKISKELYEEVGDIRSIEYAKILANLSITYLQTKQLLKAKLYADEAYNIISADTTLSKRTLAIVANDLGLIYTNLKYYDRAFQLYKQLVDLTKRNNFNEEYSLAVGNLGDLYLLKGEYNKGIDLLRESLQTATNSNTRRTMWQEYLFAQSLSDSPDFSSELRKFDDEERKNLANIIGSFSESEWENYWIDGSQTLVSLNNIGLSKSNCSPELRTLAYNNNLYVKNMLLSSSNIFDRMSKSSNDPNIKSSYLHIKELRNRLNDKLTPKDSVPRIRQLISIEEKNIVRNINLEDYLTNVSPSFKDVVSCLNENEVALEFVHIPVIHSISNYGLFYGALVFRKGYEAPSVVMLCPEDSVDDLMENDNGDYDLSIYNIDSTKVYDLLWKPLSNILHKGDVVYYSTTGELGRISYEAISTGRVRLGDYYNLRPITSTANIINLKSKQNSYKSAVVYGGINFDEPLTNMVAEAQKYEKLEPEDNNLLATRGAIERSGWKSLPGTLAEANDVSQKLETIPIKVTLYEGNAANEESFKNMDGNSPDILHIASHGFSVPSLDETKSSYLKSSTANSNMNLSMQLSGILFAGANNSWRGNIPQNAEDGILTADEISRLDLSNTKLVVLSACKTGLGVTDFVDGVFGLQRGFKRAGVGSMVMSLWPVDDKATEKLMDLFYDNLCRGQEQHLAFKNAQLSLKKEMPDPYYWAGFIMMD